ncbi:MAG: MGMT family protein [Candidatus Pacearchaeota archaeon]
MKRKTSDVNGKVYKLVRKIPKGKVTSYGIIARKLRTSARAVGQIMKRNPYRNVPCYRVVMSNGEVGGFRGSREKEKIRLLRKEGIMLTKGLGKRKINKKFFYYFNPIARNL